MEAKCDRCHDTFEAGELTRAQLFAFTWDSRDIPEVTVRDGILCQECCAFEKVMGRGTIERVRQFVEQTGADISQLPEPVRDLLMGEM